VVTAYADHLDVEFVGTTGCETRSQCAANAGATACRLFAFRIPRIETGNPALSVPAAGG
jgi:hypothetical protein